MKEEIIKLYKKYIKRHNYKAWNVKLTFASDGSGMIETTKEIECFQDSKELEYLLKQ